MRSRHLRIRVTDVLDLLASGLTAKEVLFELPDLEAEDIGACLRFASRRIEHPVVAAREVLEQGEPLVEISDVQQIKFKKGEKWPRQ